MKDEICKKSKVSWPKTLKRWFSVKSKAEDFHADEFNSKGGEEEWINNFNEKEACTIKKSKRTEKSSKKTVNRRSRSRIDLDSAQVTDVHNCRIFAATWNVAGKSPTSSLNLEDWLHTSPPADIYVLGFQEIVPLNAGNVLGTEDNGPAKKWLALIRKTLNSLPGTHTGGCQTPSPVPDPVVELDSDFEGSTPQTSSSFFQRQSFHSLSRSMRMIEPQLERRYSVCDRAMFGNRPSDYEPDWRWGGGGSSDEDNGPDDSPGYSNSGSLFLMEDRDKCVGNSMYCLVASKQMVGIYLTIWVRSDLRDDVRNMKVSCVGRGLMGYLGNKGSISISMSLHQTSFCFICSHLTSGQKEGDELRRNSDVMEILRKTRFPRVQRTGDEHSPQTILEHEKSRFLDFLIKLKYTKLWIWDPRSRILDQECLMKRPKVFGVGALADQNGINESKWLDRYECLVIMLLKVTYTKKCPYNNLYIVQEDLYIGLNYGVSAESWVGQKWGLKLLLFGLRN
ncbi:hypothetical protein E3N88_42717 [Mikania micrantha]|uniref:Inositol polyphosphate-related phosphatase domain-containing protein n=1 Tax=Mikania micrantha TaxID=192012 RepID=A0A5N6LGZ0_9ASTR|nr:hypothetical protein E3N88_42717 [Mikania micrantha]